FFQRGNFPQARRAHLKGLRAARRKGFREVVGRAFHDLLILETDSRNWTRVLDCASSALRAYGPGHPRLPVLAHDAAVAWMAQGEFARALPVFRAVLPTLERPHERLVVLGNVAWAAAGADRPEIFEEASGKAWEAIGPEGEGAGVAQSLLNVARGA